MSDSKAGSTSTSTVASGTAGNGAAGKDKGKLLKIMSWIFIILGCLFTLLWILAKAKAIPMSSMSNLMPVGGLVDFISFLAIFEFIIQIPAGILGLKGSFTPAKTLGIFELIFGVVIMIGSFFELGFMQVFSGVLVLVFATLFMCGIAEVNR